MNKVPRLVFCYVGNKTYDFSSKKKDFLPKNDQIWPENWHFCSFWARPCRFFRCPVDGSVGGCGVWAVSRKTPIYFMLVDCPTQLICFWIFVCSMTKLKEHTAITFCVCT